MEHLIADSGIQFITKEIEFNPSEPLLLQRGGTLKYSHIKSAKNNAIKQQKLCFFTLSCKNKRRFTCSPLGLDVALRQ